MRGDPPGHDAVAVRETDGRSTAIFRHESADPGHRLAQAVHAGCIGTAHVAFAAWAEGGSGHNRDPRPSAGG